MPSSKKQASPAGWALISGGVNHARVDADRLRKMLSKIERLVEESAAKEHLYQVAGDVLLAFPATLQRLESQLDETSYALSLMGTDYLKDRLNLSERNKVDQVLDDSMPLPAPQMRQSCERVAQQYLTKRNRRMRG
jgi:hypothetical protein